MKSSVLFVTVLTTFLGLGSSSILWVWGAMEMNLLGFLGVFFYSRGGHVAVQYFLFQAIGSLGFLFGCMVSSGLVQILSLVMKLGGAPFFIWVPAVVEGLSWGWIFFISTWQKVLVLVFLVLWAPAWGLLLLGVAGLFTSSMFGPWQKSLKGVIAYSSIGHNGWIMVGASFSQVVAWSYFFTYCFSLLWALVFFFEEPLDFSAFSLSPLKKNHLLSASLFNFLGVPPFPGFWMKVLVLFFLPSWSIMVFLIFIYLGGMFMYLWNFSMVSA